MALFPVKRVQDPAPVTNIKDINPINWRRYPSKPITGAMVLPVFVRSVTYTAGAPYVGKDADNNGETGTITRTDASRGQAWMTQNEKAAALGLTMAQDVGQSYGTGVRGKVENFEPYALGVARPVRANAYKTSQELSWNLT
jgi:hypothetical protein